jgi:hypothetical protein
MAACDQTTKVMRNVSMDTQNHCKAAKVIVAASNHNVGSWYLNLSPKNPYHANDIGRNKYNPNAVFNFIYDILL